MAARGLLTRKRLLAKAVGVGGISGVVADPRSVIDTSLKIAALSINVANNLSSGK
jgi:hypothetical protein